MKDNIYTNMINETCSFLNEMFEGLGAVYSFDSRLVAGAKMGANEKLIHNDNCTIHLMLYCNDNGSNKRLIWTKLDADLNRKFNESVIAAHKAMYREIIRLIVFGRDVEGDKISLEVPRTKLDRLTPVRAEWNGNEE
jgi:hypothetical protein